MKCNSCVHEDVCKYKIDYESLIEKVVGIDDGIGYGIFTVSVVCRRFRQKIEIPKSMYEYQSTGVTRPHGFPSTIQF